MSEVEVRVTGEQHLHVLGDRGCRLDSTAVPKATLHEALLAREEVLVRDGREGVLVHHELDALSNKHRVAVDVIAVVGGGDDIFDRHVWHSLHDEVARLACGVVVEVGLNDDDASRRDDEATRGGRGYAILVLGLHVARPIDEGVRLAPSPSARTSSTTRLMSQAGVGLV